MALESESLAQANLDTIRTEALKAAAVVMFPDLAVADITDSIGTPEYTQRRLAALTTIREWLNLEFGWMEREAARDMPWEVRYASASDREGKVRKTFKTESEARSDAKASDQTASFGYYVVKQARRPLDP